MRVLRLLDDVAPQRLRRILGRPGLASTAFRDRYGPWALVAGASEGLGAAWAEALAQRGLKLLLCARRQAPLEALCARLSHTYSTSCQPHVADLGDEAALEGLLQRCQTLELGTLVFNAAASPIGAFLDTPEALLEGVLRTNCIAPSRCVRRLAEPMRARHRGAIVLMSSLAGYQGVARIAAYAASKSFQRVLAEGLWEELRPEGVEVLACVAGATRTPGYLRSLPVGGRSPGELEPEQVVREALTALGRQPVLVAGQSNRGVAALLRLLPKSQAIRLFSANTRQLKGNP